MFSTWFQLLGLVESTFQEIKAWTFSFLVQVIKLSAKKFNYYERSHIFCHHIQNNKLYYAVGSNWFVFYYNYECWKGIGTSPASFFLLGIIKRFLTTQVWQQSRFESHTCSSFLPWSRWEVFSNNYSIILSYKYISHFIKQISHVRIWTHSQAWVVWIPTLHANNIWFGEIACRRSKQGGISKRLIVLQS